MQRAAEEEIFGFAALSSLKYANIFAFCRLAKIKTAFWMRSKIIAGNARREAAGRACENMPRHLETGGKADASFPQKRIILSKKARKQQ